MLGWCSEKLDVEDHYIAWRQAHDTPQHSFGTDGPFSFCSYPFLLSPRAKSKLLHTEARFSMTHVSYSKVYTPCTQETAHRMPSSATLGRQNQYLDFKAEDADNRR